MTAAVEAHNLISEIAFGLPPHAGIKEMLSLVARRTGITDRRLRGIWNSEARAIRAEELDALRVAAARRGEELDALREAAARRREEQDRHDYRSIIERLAFLEERVAEIDPSFPRAVAAEGREGQRVAGRPARPMAGGR